MRALLAIFVVVSGARGGEDPKRSEAADARAASLRQEVAAEVKDLDARDSWAGSYYHGDGLGVNVTLTLAPVAGFLFEWHGCLGLYDRNFGAVKADGDRLRLVPELPNTKKGFEGISQEFTVIRWGPRHYLIPPAEMVDFSNAVNSGAEPRKSVHGGFLLRGGDESTIASALPKLPEEYARCLLDAPISARVVAVGPTRLEPGLGDFNFRFTAVTLDAGSAEGVWQGMVFHVTAPKGRYEWATVNRVYDHESEAEIEEIGTDAASPAAGWSLSTRLVLR